MSNYFQSGGRPSKNGTADVVDVFVDADQLRGQQQLGTRSFAETMQARQNALNQSIERYAKAKFELERSLKAPQVAQSFDAGVWKHSLGQDVVGHRSRSGQRAVQRADAGA